nr:galactinol synthase 2 [Quercus suber]
MIYLDGDVQVFENIDQLFDLPDNHFYVVMDCFCEKTWSNTPQHKIGFCQQFPDKVQWPAELGPKPPLYFNAGFFVHGGTLVRKRTWTGKIIKLLVKTWWDIYNDETLDYKNTLASVEAEAGAEKNGLKRFLTTVSEVVVHYINAPSAA